MAGSAVDIQKEKYLRQLVRNHPLLVQFIETVVRLCPSIIQNPVCPRSILGKATSLQVLERPPTNLQIQIQAHPNVNTPTRETLSVDFNYFFK